VLRLHSTPASLRMRFPSRVKRSRMVAVHLVMMHSVQSVGADVNDVGVGARRPLQPAHARQYGRHRGGRGQTQPTPACAMTNPPPQSDVDLGPEIAEPLTT